MWRWLTRQGAGHPWWRVLVGLAYAGIGAMEVTRQATGDPWGVAMIALGALSVLMGVLGLYDRARA